MRRDAFVLVGDERMPYSQEALDLCGVKCGQRVSDMTMLRRLARADYAALVARAVIFRVRVRVLIGAAR